MSDDTGEPHAPPDVMEEATDITISPMLVDGVPLVVLSFDRKVDHVAFDYDALVETFESAIKAYEDAKKNATRDLDTN